VQACNSDPWGSTSAGINQNFTIKWNPNGVDIVTSVSWFTPANGFSFQGAAANATLQNGVAIEAPPGEEGGENSNTTPQPVVSVPSVQSATLRSPPLAAVP